MRPVIELLGQVWDDERRERAPTEPAAEDEFSEEAPTVPVAKCHNDTGAHTLVRVKQ